VSPTIFFRTGRFRDAPLIPSSSPGNRPFCASLERSRIGALSLSSSFASFCACGSSSLNFFALVSSRSFSPPTASKTFAVASLNTPSPCAAAEPSAG
jgi:hypothetical protein